MHFYWLSILPITFIRCIHNVGSIDNPESTRHEPISVSLKEKHNNNCFYDDLNGTTHKCESWTYDQKYFKSTLTQEVCLLISCSKIKLFVDLFIQILFQLKIIYFLNLYKWNLVCDRSHFNSNVQSIYFTGYLVGSILLGNLADKY